MQIKRPKGTADTFGVAVAQWQYIEGVIREVTSLFGASEIRTPTFESVDLFRQSVGEDTDIVQKEMYTFKDQGDREYVLKPEVTAGAVRAYLENSIYAWPAPAKLYYVSPVYRAERPQKGRLRQHHQFGCEYFGVASPKAEAELISMVWAFFEKLGIEGVTLRVNSVGDPSCRVAYNKALLDYLNPKADKLCELCQSRMGKNPMRVLDCKNPNCKETVENAPYPLDHISGDAKEHFEGLQQALKVLDIPFVIDKGIVRGLDYYNRTVFEFTSDDLGSQSTVCGGGRYDNLIEKNGGTKTPAVGFGMGIERLLIILEAQGKLPNLDEGVDLFLGHMGDTGASKAFQVASQLRKRGVSVLVALEDKSVKAQLKYADKKNAKYSAIIGDSELEKGKVTLKNMTDGSEIELTFDDLAMMVPTI